MAGVGVSFMGGTVGPSPPPRPHTWAPVDAPIAPVRPISLTEGRIPSVGGPHTSPVRSMEHADPTRGTTTADPARTPTWWATWIAGPDCGATVALDPATRRWLVGRAPDVAVRSDDGSLAPHHAVIEMCPVDAATRGATEEVPRVVVLAAPPPVLGDRAGRGAIALGRSLLLVHRSAPPPALDRPGGVVQRRARPHRPVPVPPREPAGLPEQPDRLSTLDDTSAAPAGLALVSSAVGLLVAVAMAVVLHQPMFLWFALSGAVVALAGWTAQRWWQRRALRRREATTRTIRARHDAALRRHQEELRAHHIAVTPTVTRAWSTAVTHDRHLWERRPADGDSLVVSIGVGGPVSMHVAVDLAVHRRVAIHGPHAPDLTRAILLQLVTQCGPADLRVVVVDEGSTPAGSWPSQGGRTPTAIDHLPHGLACSPDELGDLLADECHSSAGDTEVSASRHVVIVTPLAEQLGVRTSALRRALDTRPEVVLICVHDGPPPLTCSSELATDDTGTWWTPDRTRPAVRERALLTGVGPDRWATAVASLHWLTDPEDDDSARRLPDLVPIEEVLSLDPDTIAMRWRDTSDARPTAILGTAHDGLVAVDLVRDGPHALVVGTTGSGKSDLLRTLVLGIAVASPPDVVQFVLVDFKGGAAFDACARLPHVVGLVTDLDAGGCERVLRSLRAELRRREGILRTAGASDAGDLHRAGHAAAIDVPRLVVVVDEFAALADELPHVLDALVDIARRGRSLGVHLVLATQRAAGALSDDIRANTALRIALRLHDHSEARDVIGDDSAVRLPRRVAGRAVVRLGDDERVVFQAAYSSPVLATAVDAVTTAARNEGRHPLRRPWCDPLPTLLTDECIEKEIADPRTGAAPLCVSEPIRASEPVRGAEAAPVLLGVVDDTDGQRRRPLLWDPGEGGLLLVGGSGSGLSSALRLVRRRLGTVDRSRPTLLIDVSLDDVALHRILGAAALDPSTVLLVDRLDLVRGRLEREGREMHLEMLVHALARHASVVVTTASLAAVPSSCLSRCTTRWATHLHDPLELTAIGLRPDDNPSPVPGRIVIGGTGPDAASTAQLVWMPVEPCVDRPATPRAPRTRRPRAAAGMIVGTDLATGQEVGLCAESGEHIMVTGGRRSGRTTALATLERAWRLARPDGIVVEREPVRSSRERAPSDDLAARAAEAASLGPTLLVVDDADAIDDDSGALRSLLEGRHPTLLAAVALQPGALRGRYGHWTQEIRRHRTGLALLGADDDGDTWGIILPRRLALTPAPGRALVIRGGIVDESLGPRIIGVHER